MQDWFDDDPNMQACEWQENKIENVVPDLLYILRKSSPWLRTYHTYIREPVAVTEKLVSLNSKITENTFFL